MTAAAPSETGGGEVVVSLSKDQSKNMTDQELSYHFLKLEKSGSVKDRNQKTIKNICRVGAARAARIQKLLARNGLRSVKQ